MTTPLSSIGFTLHSPEESWKLATTVAEKGRRVSTAAGNYVVLTTDCGSELWAKLDGDNRPYAIVPHFAGATRSQLLVTQRIKYNDHALDGRLQGWINPSQGTFGFGGPLGDYPVLFESPDYAYYTSVKIPSNVTVQLAAFAQDITTFKSVEAYDSNPEKIWPSETLMTSGAAGAPGQQRGDQAPNANEAFITGLVEKSQTLENPLTLGHFHWARLKVMGGYFDVCVASDLLDTPPAPGQIISGNFWLSGRLIIEQN